MKSYMGLALALLFTVLLACSESGTADEIATSLRPSHLVIMGDDLQRLKDDFNADQGRVRLLFLSGPTCGICLRGMADLNDAFVATSQHDDRLVTFVVHVPTMAAKENHARDSMPLLDGPRVQHYWEETGIIGQHYAEVMDVDAYVWDFWAIYGPDHVWNGTLPPQPDYFEHQLGSTSGSFQVFSRELVLDAERFGGQVTEFLAELGSVQPSRQAGNEMISGEQLADGTFIPRVGQPRNVAVRQHIIGRGGYDNLKRIQRIEQQGRVEVDGISYEFQSSATRPDVLERHFDGTHTALPVDLESKLISAHEFDGLFVEWPEKGHHVSMSGMLKIGDILAWRLYMVQHDGPDWHLYIDSHSGALIRKDMLDEDRNVEYSVRQTEFREVSGFMFPHRIEYLDREGHSLGVEIVQEIIVETEEFALDDSSVTH